MTAPAEAQGRKIACRARGDASSSRERHPEHAGAPKMYQRAPVERGGPLEPADGRNGVLPSLHDQVRGHKIIF